MKPLTFWFDPISPYAYLAFEHLPQALEGCSYTVDYRPVLFAGLLGHWGQLGPAEIEPKRAWTFRQVAWHAHQLGIPMDMPAQHPFNPLALLRLGLASAPSAGLPNRRVVELLMRHVWRGGADANDPRRWRRSATRPASRSRPNCAPIPTWPSNAASSACPVSSSTAACSGAWTHCRCCARRCRLTRGSTARPGTRRRSSRLGWYAAAECQPRLS
jgi:hypothetical protein